MTSDEPVVVSLSNVRPTEINEAALHNADQFDFSLILFVAIGIAILGGLSWLIVKMYRRHKERTQANDPGLLFRELCNAHALRWTHRRALLKLAQIRKLSNPCLVIIDAALWPDAEEPLISRGLQNKLTELHRRLFQPISPEKSA